MKLDKIVHNEFESLCWDVDPYDLAVQQLDYLMNFSPHDSSRENENSGKAPFEQNEGLSVPAFEVGDVNDKIIRGHILSERDKIVEVTISQTGVFLDFYFDKEEWTVKYIVSADGGLTPVGLWVENSPIEDLSALNIPTYHLSPQPLAPDETLLQVLSATQPLSILANSKLGDIPDFRKLHSLLRRDLTTAFNELYYTSSSMTTPSAVLAERGVSFLESPYYAGVDVLEEEVGRHAIEFRGRALQLTETRGDLYRAQVVQRPEVEFLEIARTNEDGGGWTVQLGRDNTRIDHYFKVKEGGQGFDIVLGFTATLESGVKLVEVSDGDRVILLSDMDLEAEGTALRIEGVNPSDIRTLIRPLVLGSLPKSQLRKEGVTKILEIHHKLLNMWVRNNLEIIESFLKSEGEDVATGLEQTIRTQSDRSD